jgi:hypothetical protein
MALATVACDFGGARSEIAGVRQEVQEAKASAIRAHQRLVAVEKELVEIKAAASTQSDRLQAVESIQPSRILDLTGGGYQYIDQKFALINVSVKPYLGGVQLRGAVVNTTGVGYSNAFFDIVIFGTTRQVLIPWLPPGGKGAFEAKFPEVPPGLAGSAIITPGQMLMHSR